MLLVIYSIVVSVSFFLNVFQFFTKPKPPKGYYIYGDVGKRLTLNLILTFLEFSCFSFLTFIIRWFFFTFRHREDYGDGHVLFVRRDRKEKAGSFPWIYVGRA